MSEARTHHPPPGPRTHTTKTRCPAIEPGEFETQILNFSSFSKLEDSNFLDRRDSNLSYFSHRNCDKAKTEGNSIRICITAVLSAGNTNLYLLKCNICFAWDGVRNFEDATTLSTHL